MIPYGRQWITDEDVAAVAAALRDELITLGPKVDAFEQNVAVYCGARYAVAANSATSSLHLACLALGVGPGDFVWTVPNTFVASANCALYCGATVDFVDIDPLTHLLSIPSLEEKLLEADKSGKLPKVLIPVHFSGKSCDMRSISKLAEKYGFRVIEDASHAIGAKYEGAEVGNCAYSDITVFSFHPVKIVTAGEGGMALTNEVALFERMRRLRTHGITRDKCAFENAEREEWSYEQHELGFNYRITDFQAALGISQFNRLDDLVRTRNQIASYYSAEFASLEVLLPEVEEGHYSAWHLYVIGIIAPGTDRKRAYYEYRKQGVGVQVHYIPVHYQPYYAKLGFRKGMFPGAETYYERALTLPLYPLMSDTEINQVVDTTRRLFG